MAKRKRRVVHAGVQGGGGAALQVGRSVAEVARDLDLTETALREWVKRAEVDAGKGPPGALTTRGARGAARSSRREMKRLQMERDILKAAATFFAKESE